MMYSSFCQNLNSFNQLSIPYKLFKLQQRKIGSENAREKNLVFLVCQSLDDTVDEDEVLNCLLGFLDSIYRCRKSLLSHHLIYPCQDLVDALSATDE